MLEVKKDRALAEREVPFGLLERLARYAGVLAPTAEVRSQLL